MTNQEVLHDTIRERFSLLALFSRLLWSPLAHAQVTTADLVGTIRDSSGGVVPGVTVALTNEATGVEPLRHHG